MSLTRIWIGIQRHFARTRSHCCVRTLYRAIRTEIPVYWGRQSNLRRNTRLQGALLAAAVPVAVLYAAEKDVPLSQIISHSDHLYQENRMQELYDYVMAYKDVQTADIQWRCSRACYKLSILPSTDKDRAKQLAHSCLVFATKALELDDSNYHCHKWMGIAHSVVGDHEGTRVKIESAYKVKEHFERAIQLNPQDATMKHLLGRWCFSICDVTWIQRQIASAIFATPPTSSYEEALSYFEQAEQTEPGFYSANWLYLGKVFYQLGQKDKARHWLEKAANYHPNNEEDVQSKKEAEQLLKKV